MHVPQGVVRPQMKRTDETRFVSAQRADNFRATMRARIEKRADLAIAPAGHHDRRAGDLESAKVVYVGDLALVANQIPDLTEDFVAALLRRSWDRCRCGYRCSGWPGDSADAPYRRRFLPFAFSTFVYPLPLGLSEQGISGQRAAPHYKTRRGNHNARPGKKRMSRRTATSITINGVAAIQTCLSVIPSGATPFMT